VERKVIWSRRSESGTERAAASEERSARAISTSTQSGDSRGNMNENELEQELKELIIDALMLENVAAADIDSEEPLFVEGLGLDSIDALELAMAIDKKYGVRIKADDEQNRKIFASVKSLAAYVGQHRA
jgi:acyl carrier protein